MEFTPEFYYVLHRHKLVIAVAPLGEVTMLLCEVLSHFSWRKSYVQLNSDDQGVCHCLFFRNLEHYLIFWRAWHCLVQGTTSKPHLMLFVVSGKHLICPLE